MPTQSEKSTKTVSKRSEAEQEEHLRDVAALAEAVAEESCPVGRIEPTKILKENKITLSYGAYGDAFDGMLEHRSGRFHVYANLDRLRSHDSGRARFTLGHELGHYYIDDHRNALQTGEVVAHPSVCDHQSKNPAEREADHFASNLLMPRIRFAREAKKHAAGFGAILTLKDVFGTSITSTAVRYATLDIVPCTLVKWDNDGFSWKWFSPTTYAAGFKKTIETTSKVPSDSATGRALAGQQAPACGYFHAGTSAHAWFGGAWAGSAKDVILIEQAISLGEFGVLTLLYPEARRY